MVPIYRKFGIDYCHFDFSDEALLDFYSFETFGKGNPKEDNGWIISKKIMDITIAMWNEDMNITLFREELELDYPTWFLDKVCI